MLRRALFTTIATGIATLCRVSGQTYDEAVLVDWLKLHHAWFEFLRIYAGCPPGEQLYTLGDCKSARGTVNHQAWTTARNLAKKVFDLEEKRG